MKVVGEAKRDRAIAFTGGQPYLFGHSEIESREFRLKRARQYRARKQ